MGHMTRPKTKKPRTRRAAITSQAKDKFVEADSTYFLKLVIVIILGTLWLKFKSPLTWSDIPFGGFPIGLLVGLAGIALLEKNPIDRKIWYAVLVIVAILSYFVPAGIVV